MHSNFIKIAFCISLGVVPLHSAYAQSETPEIQLEPSFELLENGFLLKKTWARETSPSQNLGLGIFSLGFTNSTCTGTLISKEGHVLIARHCLEPAIAISESIRKFKNHLEPLLTIQQQGEISIIQYDSAYLARSLTFPVGLDDKTLYAKIFFMSAGYLTPRFSNQIKDDKVRAQHDSLSDQGLSSGGDFAIVQIDELKGKKCYKLSARSIEMGESVKSTRFSCFQTSENPWPVQAEENVILATPTAGVQNLTYIPKGSFVTSGSVVACNSGSAVRNLNDEIVGVIHSMIPFGNPSERVYRPLTLTTKRMLELMPEAQRLEIVKLNASCI